MFPLFFYDDDDDVVVALIFALHQGVRGIHGVMERDSIEIICKCVYKKQFVGFRFY